MGVIPSHAFPEAFTPICNNCGVYLCYDISEYDYERYKEFWDGWLCEVCNPEYRSMTNMYRIIKDTRQ